MTSRHQLISAIHKAGLRLDDAAVAADICVRIQREQRDALILSARAAGLSYRQIARMFGLTHPAVMAVVSRAPVQLPPATANV